MEVVVRVAAEQRRRPAEQRAAHISTRDCVQQVERDIGGELWLALRRRVARGVGEGGVHLDEGVGGAVNWVGVDQPRAAAGVTSADVEGGSLARAGQ